MRALVAERCSSADRDGRFRWAWPRTDGRYAPVHEARAPPPPPEAAEIEPPGCELRTPGTSYEAQGSLAER